LAHLTVEAMIATGVLEGPAQMAMTYCPCRSTSCDHIYVYTDGSLFREGGAAAWAVVVTGHDQQGFIDMGQLYGDIDGSDDMELSVEAASSTTLELLASIWALIWIGTTRPGCMVSLISDSLCALSTLGGSVLPASDKELGAVAHAMFQTVRSQVQLDLQHQKAHVGHPWNTLADNIAKAVALKKPLPLLGLPISLRRGCQIRSVQGMGMAAV
jgi:ribonuclease HI